MAKKATSRRATPEEADPQRRMVDAALALSARQGWRRLSLADIAAEARLPLDKAYAATASKAAILDAFNRQIDREVLSSDAEAADEPVRDRLFDIVMRRFDALRPYRAGLNGIMREAIGDPLLLLAVPALLRSMAWMLEASGVSTTGWRGRLRVQLLAGLYVSVMRVFLGDESPDLTQTMAALDRRLRWAETWLGLADGTREA